MSRLLWVAGWAGVFVWSLFCFAAYGVLDLAAGTAMRNADWFSTDPDTVEWLFRALAWLRSASSSVILVVWGLVSLTILSVPWIFDRFVGKAERTTVRGGGVPPRPGVIDLDPADYAVIRDPARPGPAPQIGRRG